MDTRVIYCGDNAPPAPAAVSLRSALDQLKNLPDACVDLIYIDPPFNSNRNYKSSGARPRRSAPARPSANPRLSPSASSEDRHESTKAYIDYMRPRCVELARVLKKTGSFYYHCDWHASHYVKVMLD